MECLKNVRFRKYSIDGIQPIKNKDSKYSVKSRIRINIYILGVFTEKPYSKPLKCNVVYIPIITLSHATSHDFK